MNPLQHTLHGRKIHFALVGCGRIAKNHLGAIANHADSFEMVGLCDNNPIHLDVAMAAIGAQGFASLTDRLTCSDTDIVFIATPNPASSIDESGPGSSCAPYKVNNIGNHQPLELMTFIKTIEDALGREAKKYFLPMQPGDVVATSAYR